MGAEIRYTGRIDFDEPVSTSAIGAELQVLHDLEQKELSSLTYTLRGDPAGLVADDRHDFGSTHQWAYALYLLETIAESQQRCLDAEATWVSDPGPFSGTLVVDSVGRFHDVLDGQCADTHRSADCGCYPPR
ncbi:hypothetical protein [Streptomyces decoyicus]|uniref:hypothetical protein n=1 Tax=Streptomyces decoyicus TaxID=249567 RepID=UPI003664CDAD